MTQHTPPPNNRNVSNPNTTNSAVIYSHKTRGTHTRVSRVRVATVGKPSIPEKQIRSCPRCKESTTSMKILNARVERIEQLVNALAKTTRSLASMSKRDDRFSQNNLKFSRIDLTHCTLQELQKLVVATTNVMVPSNSNKSTTQKPIAQKSIDSDKVDVIPETKPIIKEEEIIHSEPMEDVKIFHSEDLSIQDQNQQQKKSPSTTPVSPVKNAATSLIHNKSDLRKDSGFEDSTFPNNDKIIETDAA